MVVITVFVYCPDKKRDSFCEIFTGLGGIYRTLAKVISFPMFKPEVNQATANQEPEPLPDGVSKFMRRSKKITSKPYRLNSLCRFCVSNVVKGSRKANGLCSEYARSRNFCLVEYGGLVIMQLNILG